jgi:NAD-dependent dihydropyrimidine dehydrogenase PreA subunit
MAHVINPDICTNCGECEDACPTSAISEQNDKRVINPDDCTDCGVCVSECPVDAISEG